MITSITPSQVRTLAAVGLQKLQAGEKEVGDSYLGQVATAPEATPVERALAGTTRKVAEWARNPEIAALVHKASLTALAGGAGSSITTALLSVFDDFSQNRPHTQQGLKTGGDLLRGLSDGVICELKDARPAEALLAYCADWASTDDTWHPRKMDAQGIASGEAVQQRARQMLKEGVDDGVQAIGRLGLELPALCERPADARALGSMLLRTLAQHQTWQSPEQKFAQAAEYAIGTNRLASQQGMSDDGALGGAEEAFKMFAAGIQGQSLAALTGRLSSNIYANASIPTAEANAMARGLLCAEEGTVENLAVLLSADLRPNWHGGLDRGEGFDTAASAGIQRRVADHLATGDLKDKPLADAVIQLWKDCRASTSDDKTLCQLGSNLLSQFALHNQDAELKPLLDFTLRQDLTDAIKGGSYKLGDETSYRVGDRGKLERTFMLLEAKLHPELPVTDEMKKNAELVLQDVAAHPRDLMTAKIAEIEAADGKREAELAKPLTNATKATWLGGKVASWSGAAMLLGAVASGNAVLGGLGVAVGLGGLFAQAGMEVENDRRRWIQTDSRQEGHHRAQVQRMVDAGDRTGELARKLLGG